MVPSIESILYVLAVATMVIIVLISNFLLELRIALYP